MRSNSTLCYNSSRWACCVVDLALQHFGGSSQHSIHLTRDLAVVYSPAARINFAHCSRQTLKMVPKIPTSWGLCLVGFPSLTSGIWSGWWGVTFMIVIWRIVTSPLARLPIFLWWTKWSDWQTPHDKALCGLSLGAEGGHQSTSSRKREPKVCREMNFANSTTKLGRDSFPSQASSEAAFLPHTWIAALLPCWQGTETEIIYMCWLKSMHTHIHQNLVTYQDNSKAQENLLSGLTVTGKVRPTEVNAFVLGSVVLVLSLWPSRDHATSITPFPYLSKQQRLG